MRSTWQRSGRRVLLQSERETEVEKSWLDTHGQGERIDILLNMNETVHKNEEERVSEAFCTPVTQE